MGKNLGIELDEHSDSFIRQQLDHGRFESVSQVIEAALELFAERESRRARWLEAFEQAEGTRHGERS